MIVTGEKGKSGGGSGSGESPNTLQSDAIVSIVQALGEGEIEGFVDGLKSVFIDDTPVQNFDGSLNRQGVSIDWRYGTEEQAPFLGNGRTGTPVSVETQVKIGSGPVVRTISEYADAVQVNVRVPALAFSDPSSGDLQATSISWLVQSRALGGSWVTVEEINIFNQKCTSPYNRVTYVPRPAASSATDPFDIRVVRSTPDSTIVGLQNDTIWESYVALVKGNYQYPCTALVQLRIDAKLFNSQLGTISYRVRGLKTDVPSNYDPTTRTYTGIWDGTFKKAWHSNPAWVFWDLVTNNRYGLGEYVSAALVDKWSLYQIGQYCDQSVPSGFSDNTNTPIMQPRFTFNGVIGDREEAYKVLQNITAAFRGMAYWSLGQVFASADIPQDPVAVLTPANVIGGRFNYSGTALKARHSVALVTWNDPEDHGRPAVEVVQNNAMLSKFGWRETPVTLRGCNSRGEAHRYGKWILDTEQNETETVQFTMSWDGFVRENNQGLKPGDIILIANPRKNGNYRTGGRLAQVLSTSKVVLDFPFEPGTASYTLSVMLPSGKLEKQVVSHFDPDNKTLTLAAPFSTSPAVNGNWILESVDLNARRYRIMGVDEQDSHLFKITALFNDPTKYARVEGGLSLEPIQYVRPRNIVKQITNPTSVESRYFQNGVSHSRLTLSWTAPNDFVVEAFNVTADSPRGFQSFPATSYPSLDINDPAAGDWTFYISARSHTGATSVPVPYTVSVQGWQAVDGPIPDGLQTLEGGNTFGGRAPTIVWTNVFPPSTVTYPVTNIVRVYDTISSALLRTERVTDARYTYSYENNVNDGGPRRALRIDVTALNVTGIESAIASITINNPVPAKIVPVLHADVASIDVSWPANDFDYAGALVYASQTAGFTPGPTNLVYDGPDTKTSINFLTQGTWHVRVAIYDSFGKTGLILSDDQSLLINDLNTTLAAVLPNILDTEATALAGLDKQPATLHDINDLAEQISSIIHQVINDRDDNDVSHQRTHQVISVQSGITAALVATEQSARADADSAEASSRLALQATVNSNNIAVNAALATESLTRATTDTAQALQITTLLAQVGANAAAITAEATARATADTAISSTVTALTATVNSNTSAITTEATARANADSAAATTVSALSTTVGGNTASISTLNTSVNGVKVQFGVVGTINGVTGGFVMSGIQKLDGSVSYVVEISGSLIVNGTIAGNKLIANTVTAAQIATGTITSASGVIGILSVQSFSIGDNAVTVPKVQTIGTQNVVTVNVAQTIASFNVVVDVTGLDGKKVTVYANCVFEQSVGGGSGAFSTAGTLLVNNSSVCSYSYPAGAQPPVFPLAGSADITVGAGVTSITVPVSVSWQPGANSGSSTQVIGGTLFAMAVKR